MTEIGSEVEFAVRGRVVEVDGDILIVSVPGQGLDFEGGYVHMEVLKGSTRPVEPDEDSLRPGQVYAKDGVYYAIVAGPLIVNTETGSTMSDVLRGAALVFDV